MQSVDIFMHVQPFPQEGESQQQRGLAVFFNPTSDLIEDTYSLPLYYTGLEKQATVFLEGEPDTGKTFVLSRDYSIDVSIGK